MQDTIIVGNEPLMPPAEKPQIKTRYAPKNPLWRLLSFIIIRTFIMPSARLYCSFRLRHTAKGRKKLKGYRRNGYFLYGDTTYRDGCMIAFALNNRHTYTVVQPKVKNGRTVISTWKQLCGDIPAPADHADERAFLEAVEKRAVQKAAVVIYPREPMPQTDIDPYSYPARFNEPAFCFTTVIETDKRGKPRTVTYLDGPFYPKYGMSLADQTAYIRARIEESVRSHNSIPTLHSQTQETEK